MKPTPTSKTFLKVPVWKISREVNRLGRQLKSVVVYWPVIGRVSRIAYDLRRKTSVRVTEGRQRLCDEMAVVLIYQPKGILASTLAQLEWLVSHDISPIVVSNTPLADSDKETLSDHAFRVIERPNIGYDFGGYREGILSVLDSGLRPTALYVMNDSMWFPLREDCDTIERGRAAPEDVWGLFVDLDWRNKALNRDEMEHVQSYFFRFSRRLVGSPDFYKYWQTMPLINDKRFVIRLCEIRLAGHFFKLGYTFGGLFNWRQIADLILSITDEAQMRRILRYQCDLRQKEAALIEPLLSRSDLTALEVREKLADKIKDRQIFASTFAIHPELLLQFGIPFLKKARTADMVTQRREMIGLGLQSQFSAPVRAEVEAWDLPR